MIFCIKFYFKLTIMKKIFLGVFLLFWINFPLFAEEIQINSNLTFYSTENKRWYLNEGEVSLGNIVISGYEVKENQQFAIKIPQDFPAIFILIDSAQDNNEEVKITYAKDRKTLYFSPKQDTVNLTSLKLRIYDEAYSQGTLLLDTNNDQIFEAIDTNPMSIADERDFNKTDTLKPEPLPNVQKEILTTGIKITWDKPVDLDIQGMLIKKHVYDQDGNTLNSQEISWNQNDLEYTDTEVTNGSNISYALYLKDNYYLNEPVKVLFENLTLKEELISEDINNENNAQNNEDQKDESTEKQPENSPKTTDETLEDLASNEKKSYTRAELKTLATEIMQIKNPLERLKTLKAKMKKFSFKEKIWIMRFVINIKKGN